MTTLTDEDILVIRKLLRSCDEGMTTEELFVELRNAGHVMSIGTVYRAVRELIEQKRVTSEKVASRKAGRPQRLLKWSGK